MNIRATLLNQYSKSNLIKISRYVSDNPARFKELMAVFLDGPYRLTQRATIPIELCVKRNDSLIIPYITTFISVLKTSSDNSLRRNILRTLQFVTIPKKHQGKILEICFALINDSKAPIAVRVFSMTVAANISSKLPEIKHELKLMIEERLPFESAGYISRGRKIVKQLSAK